MSDEILLEASPKRRYGHIADHEHIVLRDLSHSPLVKLPGLVHRSSMTSEMSYAPLLDTVPDQGGTSSCVGNAMSTSVFLRAAITKKPIARPSRKAIYDFARLIDDPHKELIDQGSRPNAAIYGGQIYGFVDEKRWMLTDANVNDLPPEDIFQHSLDAKLGNYYRISSGPGCAEGIRRALATGYCPIFAMPVDQAYEDYEGDGVYAGIMGKELGSHMQCVVGYGPGYLLVCNSWSDRWGTGGIAPILDGWFDSGAVSDILVPTVVPGGVS